MTVPTPAVPPRLAGCVVSTDPLITVSKRETGLPLGIASVAPERCYGKPSLHLLGLMWSCESKAAVQEIGRDFDEAARALPQARFVMMANTHLESICFSEAGVPSILANELIFVDERLFAPLPQHARRPRIHDAAYIARLDKSKRHDLAREIEKLLLIYGHPAPGDVVRVKAMLPRARYANHEFNGGAYRLFAESEVRMHLLTSSVGLCLSQVEGAMRASMEYRLSGLPVVSTRSAGGRDRYLFGPHVRVVGDDPGEVAAGVNDLKARAFDPLVVREYVGQLVAFDRHNFLQSLNKIVERELGPRDRFCTFAPFVRYPIFWRPSEQILAPLTA